MTLTLNYPIVSPRWQQCIHVLKYENQVYETQVYETQVYETQV
jgi:hypothetical protein